MCFCAVAVSSLQNIHTERYSIYLKNDKLIVLNGPLILPNDNKVFALYLVYDDHKYLNYQPKPSSYKLMKLKKKLVKSEN